MRLLLPAGEDPIEPVIAGVGHLSSEWEGFGEPGACQLDLQCYPDWKSPAEAVLRYTLADEEFLWICSGVLLNSAAADYSPMLLTADHCIDSDTVLRSISLLWGYEGIGCDSGNYSSGNPGPDSPGGRLLARDDVSDMALLQLAPFNVTNRVWAGWSTTTQIGAGLTAIHHPRGSFKRITFGSWKEESAPPPAFISVGITGGMLEPGSSGGPLFNPEQLVIGTVSHGTATCANPEGSAYFGALRSFYSKAAQYLESGIADDRLEPNNARPQAAPVSPQEYPDLVIKYGEEDWYALTLPGSTGLLVENLAPPGLVTTTYLNDSSSPRYGTPADFISPPEGGTYFIRIAPGTQARQDYGLRFTAFTPQPPQITSAGIESLQVDRVRFRVAAAINRFASRAVIEYGLQPDLSDMNDFYWGPLGGPGLEEAQTVLELPYVKPDTVHYYRIAVKNLAGTARTPIQSFRTAPPISISPILLDFGTVLAGTRHSSQLTVRLEANSSLEVAIPALPSPFAQTNNCTVLLGSWGPCTVHVTYSPGEPGQHSVVLRPQYGPGLPVSDTVSVELRARAVGLQLHRPRRPSRAAITSSSAFELEVIAGAPVEGQLSAACDGLPEGYRCVFYEYPLRLINGSAVLRGEVVRSPGRLRQSPVRTSRIGGRTANVTVSVSTGPIKQSLVVPVKLP